MRAAWTLDRRTAISANSWIVSPLRPAMDSLADAYETAIAKTEGLTKRELLSALAQLHDKRRDDPRRALAAWERLFRARYDGASAHREMEALSTLLSDWATLVHVLTKKADLVPDDETRAATWAGSARRSAHAGGQRGKRIDAYERALELEPSSAFTIDHSGGALRAEERRGSPRGSLSAQGRSLRRRGGRSQIPAAGRRLRAIRERPVRPREAIECLNQALAVRPNDRDVLRRLDALYTHERLWQELLDNLNLQAAVAVDDDARRTLRKRIAALACRGAQDAQSRFAFLYLSLILLVWFFSFL